MKKLLLSKDLAVPVDIVTEALAWIGARGSGKTHGAGKLAELLIEAGVPVVILDPVGVWYGLRLAKDGKGRGLSIPVFGGLHGDVPLESTGGALVADLVVDKNLSAVLDMSQFESDAQKARFVADFSNRLFIRKKKEPGIIHIIYDEAQEVVPQNPQRGEEFMVHYVQRILKLGRNFGMGASLLTQRPQEVNKKALNQCQTVLAFRLTGPQERKAMREWIAAHDLDDSLLEKLPGLETGNCHVWSPAFLKVSKEVRILPKETFDASATPKFGERRATRELAPIDLEQLREAMKATVEKAEAADPKLLQDKVRRLERQVKELNDHPMVKVQEPKVKVVEKPILRAGELDRIEKLLENGLKNLDKALILHKETSDLVSKLNVLVHDAKRPLEFTKVKGEKGPGTLTFPPPRPAAAAPAPRRQVRPEGLVGAEVLSNPQQRILATLVFLESLGVEKADKYQVALFMGVKGSSGSYANNLGSLRSAGLLDHQGPQVWLTEQGRANAPEVAVPTTTAELHATVLSKVSNPQAAVLRIVLKTYPNTVTKESVAEELGVLATSGSFANNLGALRTLGALTYPSTGHVRAADIMFIDGRK